MLTKQQQKELEDHFNNNERYDPSMDPEQTPSHFAPKLCKGGPVGDHRDKASGIAENYDTGGVAMYKGGPVKMDDGGTVPEGLAADSGNSPFGVSDSPRYITNAQQQQMAAQNLAAKNAPLKDAVADTPTAQPSLPQAVAQAAPQAPAATASPAMAPDQTDSLINALQSPTTGQKLARGIGGGLSTFADAIMQGVARAGPGQFSKNANEATHNQQQALIDALRLKYDKQFQKAGLNLKGAELQNTIKHQGVEEGQKNQELGQGAQKAKVDAAQKVVEAYEKGSVFNPSGVSAQDYKNAQKVLESSGTANVPTQTKNINGQNYHQINGKWFKE